MKRILFTISLCCLAYNVLAKVRIGVPLFTPPYVVEDKLIGPRGSDIDLMNTICKRLQWECEYVPMVYSNLLPAVARQEVDYALGALIITPERQAQFLFSMPYMPSEGGFVLLQNSPLSSFKDLQGKRIGVLSGREYYHYLVQRMSSQITIVPYDILGDLILDLKDGKIDAVFMNYLGALYVEHQYPDKIKVLNDKFKVGDGLGIAALPSNLDGIKQINNLILQFDSDGTFVNSYNYTFGFFAGQAAQKE